MDSFSILAWLALILGFLAFARYRGASFATIGVCFATALLLSAASVVAAVVLGLEASLWALVGLAIGLVLFIVMRWTRERSDAGPEKSPFDFS